MPKGYTGSYDDPGSVGEQLLGRGDGKRSTKTFIEDGVLAMFLGMVQGLPKMMINMGKRLHAEEMGIDFKSIEDDDIFEEYPEARELLELHQRIIEHKGSQTGFLVHAYTERASDEEIDRREKKKQSSGELGESRWK